MQLSLLARRARALHFTCRALLSLLAYSARRSAGSLSCVGVASFTEYLASRSASLTSVDLSGNELGWKSATSLGEALGRNKSLTNLDIS